MAESEGRELRDLTQEVAGVERELGKIRTAIERIVIILVVMMILSLLFGLLFLSQADRVTGPFGG